MKAPPELPSLTASEARARLARFGPNELASRDRFAWLRDVLRVALDPMALMLAVTGGVYLALGQRRDGIAMFVALGPILAVDAVLDVRSRAALKKLAEAVSPRARVVRDGEIVEIPTAEVVPGDTLVLAEGDVVHADGALLASANLALDESSLTGESEPQSKGVGASFFAGSRVLAGQAFGTVTETGARTRFGDVARLAVEAEATTPLQRRLARFVARLTVVAVAVAAGVFFLGLARHESWSRAFVAAVSLAMSAIPEEFPIVFALFLSVAAFRLGKHGMLVRRLASVETLGSTTVICTDKTGTLTRGKFVLDVHVPLSGARDADVREAAVLACEPDPVDPMDRAIVEWAGGGPRGWTLVRDHDFDPIGKHMSHVWSDGRGGIRVVAKGSLEGVLAHCDLEPGARRAIEREHERLGANAMRVLALAARDGRDGPATREEDERGLVPIALLGFRDPLRPEVPAAVAECQAAGVAVKIITGDHALTAHAIAHAAGIAHGDDGIVTGDELDALDDRARADRVARATIFARIGPRQKYAIVDALERRGEIVAMTGDGINDVPALRRADIGISMGLRGTEVARAASDLVLLDDDFASIVATLRDGRHLYANIQSAFLYILAFHVPIVALALLVPVAGMPLLLQPIHLVWLELIVHPVSALVFQADAPRPEVMRRPPRDPRAPLLPLRATLASVGAGAALTAVALLVYARLAPSGVAHARTLALGVLLTGYAWLVWLERRAIDPARVTVLPRSPWSYVVWIASAASLPVAVASPLAGALQLSALSPLEWLAAVALGTAALAWRPLVDRGKSGARRAPADRPRSAPAVATSAVRSRGA